MSGRHVALDTDGQQARPATGLDSLVDPAGPEPDGVTLLWRGLRGDYSDAYHFARATGGGWYSTDQPEAPLADGPGAWTFGGRGAFPMGRGPLVVARTATDDGRRSGRHHVSRPLLPAPYIGVVLACGRAQRRQQAERIIPASCVQQWAARVLDHLNTITAEPTPVTCEHCHGEGCEDCRNHGVRPELIDERDILGGDA